ncbi:MAG TPA: tetratricopeptide repeat protein [Verrucomicrobiales bacterium]|nr:tetratricopeptide repeat protein [Verrucomicrobiales bacterium]HIL69245.1 tetratricopeptide repeat protein [Verrucomicrobiota bacterium]
MKTPLHKLIVAFLLFDVLIVVIILGLKDRKTSPLKSPETASVTGSDSLFIEQMDAGKTYYDSGEFDKATTAFQAATEAAPTHPDAVLNLAKSHLKSQRYQEALDMGRKAIRMDRNSADAYYVVGCAELRLGNHETAEQAFWDCIVFNEDIAAVHFQLGQAYESQDKHEDALIEYDIVIGIDEKHPSAHYRLSQVYLRTDAKIEAEKALIRHQAILKELSSPVGQEELLSCIYTEVRAPKFLELPNSEGIPLTFVDVTEQSFDDAEKYSGPAGVIDVRRSGAQDLFVYEKEQGLRLLFNTNGVFRPEGFPIPTTQTSFTQCLIADLDNEDRSADALLISPGGIQIYRFSTNGFITDMSRFANLSQTKSVVGALADLDFTGKLDFLFVSQTNATAQVYRNHGNFQFEQHSEAAGIPQPTDNIRSIRVDDWDNDDLPDVFLTRTDLPPILLKDQRGGPLTASDETEDWPTGEWLELGDLNNDLRIDGVVANQEHLEIVLNSLDTRYKLPLDGFKLNGMVLTDFDNDGWLDICAYGEGLKLWRNIGTDGFTEVTEKVGLQSRMNLDIMSLSCADFDNDCDIDFLISKTGGGLKLLSNKGGNANKMIKYRLYGNRSNHSGIGIRLELKAGGLRMARTVNTLPIHIGLGAHDQIQQTAVRWFDNVLTSSDDQVPQDCSTLTLLEIKIMSGSCPFLYAWDGHSFRFVTDLLGGSPLGLRITDDHFIDSDPTEHVWIGDESIFPQKEGSYVLQITEELREALYLDEVQLVVVDHQVNTEVHPIDKLQFKPFPVSRLDTFEQLQLPIKAVRSDGLDVTQALNRIDREVCSPVKLRQGQLRGLAELFHVDLDFGEMDKDEDRHLILTGWLQFGGGMANVAASHYPNLPFPFPQLQARTERGEWQPVDVFVGAPIGKTKTITVDLTGKLPENTQHLRLSTGFEIHWDRIALMDSTTDSSLNQVTVLKPSTTDLHWRGYSEYKDSPWTQPLTPDYEQVTNLAKWNRQVQGWSTRYGSVDELLAKRDEALVIMNGGDELTLTFDASALPPKPEGFRRDFYLYSDGWDKDGDYHVQEGLTVEPIPWHGLDDQKYGKQIRPDFPNDHWIQKYNTRWVGPYTITSK